MYIGIDLGGTNLVAGLVTRDGEILHSEKCPMGKEPSQQTIIKKMIELCQLLMTNESCQKDSLKGIGIGSPGIVDNETGIAVYNPNIPGLHQTPLRSSLQKEFGLPIEIANDADVAALAEGIVGAGKGSNYSLTITLGTGVGGGVVVNKKLYRGNNAAGIELGHILLQMGGEKCGCGRQGCFEAYASATALISQTRRAVRENPTSLLAKSYSNLDDIDGKSAFIAAKAKCPVGEMVVVNYIKYLAEGICSLIVSFQPEIITIGGGVCNEGDNLLIPLRSKVAQLVYGSKYQNCKIERAKLGNDAGVIGAAMLCLK